MRGKRYKRVIILLVLAFFTENLFSVELNILPDETPPPGSAIVISVTGVRDLNEKIDVRVDGVEVPICGRRDNAIFVLYGIDLFRRGKIIIEVVAREQKLTKEIQIRDYEFPVERLTLPPEKVFLSEEDLRRAEDEKRLLDSIWVNVTPERLWNGEFILPAKGEEGSLFGVRRIINGEERSPHTGRDIIANEGAPVNAINRGRVVFTGDLFFGGKSIVIDHGLGLYSMYFHLSRVFVSKGDLVDKGQKIGLVGSTGRASGPHLHWGVRLLNARVDPYYLKNINF